MDGATLESTKKERFNGPIIKIVAKEKTLILFTAGESDERKQRPVHSAVK